MGYIPLGPLNLTIIHITVIVAALVLGPKDGALVGGVWGMITFIRAFVLPTSPLATIVFTNPLVSVLPRILIGVVAGYTFMWLSKRLSSKILATGVAAVLGSLTNTVLVLGQIYLFTKDKHQQCMPWMWRLLLPYLLGVVATNGLPEAALATIIAPSVALPLLRKLKA